MRFYIGLMTLLLAYACLYPGLTKPMITIDGTVDKAEIVALGKNVIIADPNIPALVSGMAIAMIDSLDVQGEIKAYRKSRSILGTVKSLFDANYYLVGFLIMLFSVVVPVTKGLLMVIAYSMSRGSIKRWSLKISGLISKWSMADVFVVAIIVSYLAFNATEKSEPLLTLNATFGGGFYYFLAYCLLSLLSVQLMPVKKSV